MRPEKIKVNNGWLTPIEHALKLKDIADLLHCNAIYMLQGWQESKGARIEHYIATELGLHIMYEVEQLIMNDNE